MFDSNRVRGVTWCKEDEMLCYSSSSELTPLLFYLGETPYTFWYIQYNVIGPGSENTNNTFGGLIAIF